MTSTNDGKDVKSNHTSGHRGKKYYLELYNTLEERLSGSESLAQRARFLCEAWRRIHSICRHAAPPSHPILVAWLERHTASATLQSQWQSPDTEAERTAFDETLVSVAHEIDSYVSERNGVRQPWEEVLLRRAEWYRSVLGNPWGHPVLKVLLDPKETPPDEGTIIEWLKGEREPMFVRRIQELVAQKCNDIAIALVTVVMDRRRAARSPPSDVEQAEERRDTPDHMEPTFENILRAQCGFTDDGWGFLADAEFALLHKADRLARFFELAKLTPLKNGYDLIDSLQNRLRKAKTSREKKMWKNVNDVAELIAQIMIARCMVVPTCTGAVRSALYKCAHALCALLPTERVKKDMVALAIPAVTATHLYTLAKAVHKQRSSDDMKPFVCELYVRAITSGMNELEKLKLKADKEKEARNAEQTLASWFLELGGVFGSARLRGECALTAFSVHPSLEMFDRIKATPDLPPVRIAEHLEQKTEITSEFGSWANDSRTHTNFVKTSEHLNMKQTQQANVLSTAILNEGEGLGLGLELRQDIAVLLSGLRVKTLSWDLDREVLLTNCLSHMERTAAGTRALTTELRFLHLDPKDYQHLKEEEDDDENDMYYGIEKGYEHLVEFPEPQPEAVWEDDLIFDEERTESAYSTEAEDAPKSRKKKAKKPTHISGEDEDPLSLVAEAKKNEKKKERPHSKERSKERGAERSKERKKNSNKERSHSKDKESKKVKKERKKKIKAEKQSTGPLCQLIGVKVERPNDALESDYEGKSSLASLFAETETNVEYDGQFSMDELTSPDRSSPNKTTPQKAHEHAASIVNINRTPAKHDKLAQTAEYPKPVPINKDVKNEIAKLIHFRLKKSNTSTESSNSPAQSPLPILSLPKEESKGKTDRMLNLVGSKIMNASQIPRSVLNTSQSLQLTNLKNEISNLLKASTSQCQSIETSNYVNRTINKVLYEPANMKDTCSRMMPVKSYSKNRICSIPQLQLNNLESSPQKKEDKQVQNLWQKTIQNIPPGNQHILPQAKQQHNFLHGNKPQNCPQEKHVNCSTEHKNNTPRQSVIVDHKSPDKSSVSHQRSFEDFVKDMQGSIKPDHVTNTTQENLRKIMKPVNKITPVVPNILKCSRATPVIRSVLKEEPTAYQSAKPVVQQKKAENAPNTFSRLSYMHKSKQNDAKPKHDSERNRQALNRSISEELDKRIAEMHQLAVNAKGNQTNLVIPKVINTDGVCTKPQESPTVEIFKLGPPNSSVMDNHPILKHKLQTNEVGTASRKVNKDTKAVPRPVLKSALSEKDQQDLINMLKQQNKLNEPLRQPKANASTMLTNLLSLNPAITITNNCPVVASSQLLKPVSNQIVNVNHQQKLSNQSKNSSAQTEKKELNAQLISKATIMRTADLIHSRIMSSQAKIPSTVVQSTSKTNSTVIKTDKVIKSADIKTEPQSILAITSLPNARKDIDKIVNRPAKLSNVEKKYEAKSNRTSIMTVMDSLRKHKTPSRGPSALEMVLGTDAFEKYNNTQNLRNQRIVRPKSELINQPIAVNKGTKKPIQTPIPVEYTSKVNAQPLKPKEPVQPKIQINVEFANNQPVIKIQEIPKVTTPISLSLNCETLREDDPFISGILNSDYDLLDELMDDDLRQEIGELSSDEERTYTAPIITKDSNMIVKSGGNVLNKCVSTNSNDRHLKKEQNSPKPKAGGEISNPITDKIVLNPNNTVDVKPYVSKSKAKLEILSNEKVNIIARPDIIQHFKKKIAPQTNYEKTSHAKYFVSGQVQPGKVDTKNMIITVPPPASSNMVVVRPDMAYESFPTLHIKEAPINSNMTSYVATNNAPIINNVQLTTFTPVLTPVLVQNSMGLSTQVATGGNTPFNTVLTPQTRIQGSANVLLTNPSSEPTKIMEMYTCIENASTPDSFIEPNKLVQVSSMEKTLPKPNTKKSDKSKTTKFSKAGRCKPVLCSLQNPIPIIKYDDINNYPGPQIKHKIDIPLEQPKPEGNIVTPEATVRKIRSKPVKLLSKVKLKSGNQQPSYVISKLGNQAKPEQDNFTTPNNSDDYKQEKAINKDEIKLNAENKKKYSNLIPQSKSNMKLQTKTHQIPTTETYHTHEFNRNVDANVNISCETKVLSEAQEQLSISSPEKEESKFTRNPRLSTEKDKTIEDLKEKERLNGRESLKKKRLAIINREISHRCFESAIALPYAPIKIETLNTLLLKKPKEKVEIHTNNPTITSQPSEFISENSKTPESHGNIQKSVLKITDMSKGNVTLGKAKKPKTKKRRTKKEPTEIVATDSLNTQMDSQEITAANVKNSAEITPTRVSRRIRERKFKKIVTVTSETVSEIDGKELSSVAQISVTEKSVSVSSKAVSETDVKELVNPYVASISLISNVNTNLIKNTTIPEICTPLEHETVVNSKDNNKVTLCSEVPSNQINVEPSKTIKTTFIPEISTSLEHDIVLNSKNTNEVSKPSLVPSNKINVKSIKPTPKLDTTYATADNSQVENETIQILSSPEDTPDELSYPNAKKVATAQKELLDVNIIANDANKQFSSTVALTPIPVISAVPKLVTSLCNQNFEKILEQKKSESEKSIVTAEKKQINVISRDENGKPVVDTISIPEVPIIKQSTAENKCNSSDADIIPIDSDLESDINEDANAQASSNQVHKSDDIAQSYKKSLSFQELPIYNPDNPNMRCVRIKLPSGKAFKATINGTMKINFDTLFEDPALKNVLLSGITDNKRFLLNVQQLSTPNHKVVDAKIKTITSRPQKLISDSEVVNLISDDEGDSQEVLKQSTKKIATEFGTFAVRSEDEDALTKHQSKLFQKCSVKLMNCDPQNSRRDVAFTESPKNEVKSNHMKATLNADTDDTRPVLPHNKNIVNDNAKEVFTTTATEIINLDDSSDEDGTSKTHSGEKIHELKSLLLKDLGVADISTDNSAYNNDIENNQKVSSPSEPKKKYKAYVEPTKKDYTNIVPYNCFVKLTRCDDLVRVVEDKIKKINISNKDTDVDVDFEPKLSRNGSFSILNDLVGLDDVVELAEADMDRSSPIIDILSTITALHEAFEIDKCNLPTSVQTPTASEYDSYETSECFSDWFFTKRGIRRRLTCDFISESDTDMDIVINSKTDVLTDYESYMDTTLWSSKMSDLQNTSVSETSAVPSLKKLLTEYYTNDSALHLNKSMTLPKKGISITCKRKSVDEYNEVASKVSKIDSSTCDSPIPEITSSKAFCKLESNTVHMCEVQTEASQEYSKDEIIVDHLHNICLKKIVCNYILKNFASVTLYTNYSYQREQKNHEPPGYQNKASQGGNYIYEVGVRCEGDLNQNKDSDIFKVMDVDDSLRIKVKDNNVVNLGNEKELPFLTPDEEVLDNANITIKKIRNEETKELHFDFSTEERENTAIKILSNVEEKTIEQDSGDLSFNNNQIKDQNEIATLDEICAEISPETLDLDIKSPSLQKQEEESVFSISEPSDDTNVVINKYIAALDVTYNVSAEMLSEATMTSENKSTTEYSEIQEDKPTEISSLAIPLKPKPNYENYSQNDVQISENYCDTTGYCDAIIKYIINPNVTNQDVSFDLKIEAKMTSDKITKCLKNINDKLLRTKLVTKSNTYSQNDDKISELYCDTTFAITKDIVNKVITNQDVSTDLEISATFSSENKSITQSLEVLEDRPTKTTSPGGPIETTQGTNSETYYQNDPIIKDIINSDVTNQDESENMEWKMATMTPEISKSSEILEDIPAKITYHGVTLDTTLEINYETNPQSSVNFSEHNSDTTFAKTNSIVNSDVTKQDVIPYLENETTLTTEYKSIKLSPENLGNKPAENTLSRVPLDLIKETNFETITQNDQISKHFCGTPFANKNDTADGCITKQDAYVEFEARLTSENKSIIVSSQNLEDKAAKLTLPEVALQMTPEANNEDSDQISEHCFATTLAITKDTADSYLEGKETTTLDNKSNYKLNAKFSSDITTELLETRINIIDEPTQKYFRISENNCETNFEISKDNTDFYHCNQDKSVDIETKDNKFINESPEKLETKDNEVTSGNSRAPLENIYLPSQNNVQTEGPEETMLRSVDDIAEVSPKSTTAFVIKSPTTNIQEEESNFSIIDLLGGTNVKNQDLNVDIVTKSLMRSNNRSITESAEKIAAKPAKINLTQVNLETTSESIHESYPKTNDQISERNLDMSAKIQYGTIEKKYTYEYIIKLKDKAIDNTTELLEIIPEIINETSQNNDKFTQDNSDQFAKVLDKTPLTSFEVTEYPKIDFECDKLNISVNTEGVSKEDVAGIDNLTLLGIKDNCHDYEIHKTSEINYNDLEENKYNLGSDIKTNSISGKEKTPNINNDNEATVTSSTAALPTQEYINITSNTISLEIENCNRQCMEEIRDLDLAKKVRQKDEVDVKSNENIKSDKAHFIGDEKYLTVDQSTYYCETEVVVDRTDDTESPLYDSIIKSSTFEERSTDEIRENILNDKVAVMYKEDNGVLLKGVEYEDPVADVVYVFALEKSSHSSSSASISNATIKSDENDGEISSDKGEKETDSSINSSEIMDVVVSTCTYSRRNLKRKLVLGDTLKTVKKMRFSKSKRNINARKLSNAAICGSLYTTQFTRLLEYCSNIEFSYSISFHKDQVDVENLFNDWPIRGDVRNKMQIPEKREETELLFEDLDKKPPFDPFKQTLSEELVYEYIIEEPCKADDSNFNMGFGEGSGRVIQNLESGGSTKFSAATLSDVKHSQPFLFSDDYDVCGNENVYISKEQDQIEKIKRSIARIQLRDKVRSFFEKTALELTRDFVNDKEKTSELATTLSDLYIPNSFQPAPVDVVVQVVQVGQLPVSAAAQNPVICDPRVTQVSDASPSQCSEENSPREDSQQGIKTEYTELTTADLSMPMESYQSHNQDVPIQTQEAKNISMTADNIPIETELIKTEVKIELVEETSEDAKIDEKMDDALSISNNHVNNIAYTFDTNASMEPDTNMQIIQPMSDMYSQQKQQNGAPEKTDQIAHAMSAAGISTSAEPVHNNRAQALVNIISQKIRHSNGNTAQNSINTYSKSPITAMALQQALAQILPPPLNQTNASENNQQSQKNPSVTPQVLHIVQGKNASGNQITLVDNTQQSVINQNGTPVLHIVQNKAPNSTSSSSGNPSQQQNTFSGLSLVDTGLQQGGNQLLHIVNTGNQKNTNAGQLLKRVNLLTNLTNVPGSNEQKMVQFVCKSADGKSIQLNAPHQRSMVLRLQPIETPNIQTTQSKPMENQDMSPSPNTPNSGQNKDFAATQHEIKSRSVYEENYAKFIQSSSVKPLGEKSTSLPKFNQAFGKSSFQDGNPKQNEISANNSHLPSVNTNNENNECPQTDNNPINLEHISQISSPPLLLRKSPQTSQSQQNLVQQIKQTIAPMNIQTMHGGVIYTRQIPVNIGGGQTINLITVPSTELMDDKQQPEVKFVNQSGEMEPSIIKIVPQSQPVTNAEIAQDEGNNNVNMSNDNAQNTQTQPVLTQMRIKLPMLSKTPQMVSGARVVRPSFFQIQRNVIGGANQQVYQQLVLTAAPPLGQQTIRLPQAQVARPVKVPSDTQSSPESQMSSSTLEQLREFDMVLEQVKERSTVQPNSSVFKLNTTSSDTTDSNVSGCSTPVETSQPVLYSIGGSQLNVAYVNRKAAVATPSTSTFVRSPDSSGIADSPSSSNQAQASQSVSNEPCSSGTSLQSRARVSSKSKSRPKSSHSQVKINSVPPKPTTQKPLEDEQTTQRILYILAEYKEQVENSPDKDKPAPRRRSNPPSNPGSSKRKKSSSGSRRTGTREVSPVQGDDTCRTMGSEDSSCGTSQGDCTEICMETHSPQDSPRKVARKITFEQEPAISQPRPQPQRNVIVADGQTITVARGADGKPATAVLMPANYILPVSMVKGGQQIAIVTNRGPKLLTVGGGEGGATNALLLQRLIGPAGLKPVLARPGVRHVRLPTAAIHNLQTFNLATATTVQPPDSTASPAPAPPPPELIDTRAESSPWSEREADDVRPDRPPSPEGSEPWNMPTSSDTQEYSYEETVRAENMDRTVLDPIPDRYSPDMEAQRIFDKMFDVESKKCFIVDSHDEPHCGYGVEASEDDKAYQVVQKKEGTSHRQHRVTHISAAALRHKYAILEHELRLQKSLSEECEDLGVDSPSASELFPEAELLFAASPAQDPGEASHHNPHTPQPTHHNQNAIQPDIDDQIATDQLLPREEVPQERPQLDVSLGLGDVGIVTVSEDGMQATIELDQEEFARSHPNTTFHSEPTDVEVQQPFTITGIKGGRQISTIFHANRVPGTVLMTAPQATGTVISQTAVEPPTDQGNIKYSDIDHMISTLPGTHTNNVNLNSVLVKDDGLTRFENILTDSRELHLSNTASAIVHPTGNATQVIRRVCYDEDKRERDARFLMDEPDTLIAGDDAKMIAEDSSRDATMESMAGDVDDDNSSPERHAELFWESNSASERSESRRPLDFSSDSDKCCKSPYFDETNSTDSSGVGSHVRLDSVIKEARVGRSGSAEGSSADDTHPPLRTYPPKRMYHNPETEMERSMSGKTRAGERSPDLVEGRRRTSVRGVVKRGCHCCNGSPTPAPPRPKKPRQRKPTLDFNTNN